MQTHSYSTILRDVSWSDIGKSVDAVEQLDGGNVDLRIVHDTSGGTLDDGTTFQTETVLTAEYAYSLGDGQTALDAFANKLSQVPALPSDVNSLASEIKERGG
jgi:hypothetical protein